jgi:coenzyme F420-reducing hydrogenase delta subunit
MAGKPGTARKKPGRITALLCENSAWKAYRDAAAAGAECSRVLEGLDAVKLPCSGKIEVGLILRLLENGSAGVLVLGCPKDNCTFIRGNYRAEKRVVAAKAALREAGLDEGLVRLEFLSSLDSRKLLDFVGIFKRYIDDHSRS